MRIRRIAIVGGMCILLGLVWGLITDRAEAAKKPAPMCNNVTAAAVFRDDPGDGLKSDGLPVYGSPTYGSPSEYHGWDDSLVCLMENDDWDFIMGTTSTKYEINGWDREVTLNFPENPEDPVPFPLTLTTEVLIRSDYIYNLEDPGPRRLIVWFTANRVDYKLYFDDGGSTNPVWVTVTGTTPNRVWTIESFGWGRLEGPRKVGIVGYYYMPFKIAIHETGQPKTCL
jgi:hypothetical protein